MDGDELIRWVIEDLGIIEAVEADDELIIFKGIRGKATVEFVVSVEEIIRKVLPNYRIKRIEQMAGKKIYHLSYY